MNKHLSYLWSILAILTMASSFFADTKIDGQILAGFSILALIVSNQYRIMSCMPSA